MKGSERNRRSGGDRRNVGLTALDLAALQRLHDDIHVEHHRKLGHEIGVVAVDGTIVLEAKMALAKILASHD